MFIQTDDGLKWKPKSQVTELVQPLLHAVCPSVPKSLA